MSAQPVTISELGPGTLIVALGANLDSPVGAPAATFRAVLDELATVSRSPLLCSRYYRTNPQDCQPGSPEFLNAVVALEVDPKQEADAILATLLEMEARFGRRRGGEENAPRSLDLDLICFGERQMATPALTLPHPRVQERQFVLQPLADLAPELVLPGFSDTVADLLRTLESGA